MTKISPKKNKKAVLVAISALLIAFFQLPLAFSRSHETARLVAAATTVSPDSIFSAAATNERVSLYDSLHLELMGLSEPAFDAAKKGWQKLAGAGQIPNQSIITIVDFSQPSNRKRLFVLDMKNYRVVFNTWVAHGKNSGKEMARSFSNLQSSFKSSLGFYTTGETYFGGNGYSLKLNGLEKGINDHANDRAIVLHGADYVGQSFIDARGFLGRSYGCPAVPAQEASPIINTIKGGTCLFIYSPNQQYFKRSPILGA